MKQNPRRRLCASLRSRNAHGHRTRAILCENLREKGQKPDGAPWSSTTLNLTPSVKTPNCVDTLGNHGLTPKFLGGTPNPGIFMAQHPTSIAFEAPACAASRDTSAAPPSAGAGSDALGGHLAGGTPWPLDVWKTIGKPKKIIGKPQDSTKKKWEIHGISWDL